jgi:hypothetical protein
MKSSHKIRQLRADYVDRCFVRCDDTMTRMQSLITILVDLPEAKLRLD